MKPTIFEGQTHKKKTDLHSAEITERIFEKCRKVFKNQRKALFVTEFSGILGSVTRM